MTVKRTTAGACDAPVSSLWRHVATGAIALGCAMTHTIALCAGASPSAPPPGDAPTYEWVTLGSDYAHTRYAPVSQVNAENFTQLKTAWVWDGASFNARSGRSTPSYVDGKLFTVAGDRRYVVAIDPATGETIWSYVEPKTRRWEYSMRKDYGKGVAYAKIDGRGVIYIVSP
ncbi:MAG TPA: hypothetical protein VIL28_01825, partial [Steroidobacteraceae bacterium]